MDLKLRDSERASPKTGWIVFDESHAMMNKSLPFLHKRASFNLREDLSPDHAH
jgi:hypothetical protein